MLPCDALPGSHDATARPCYAATPHRLRMGHAKAMLPCCHAAMLPCCYELGVQEARRLARSQRQRLTGHHATPPMPHPARSRQPSQAAPQPPPASSPRRPPPPCPHGPGPLPRAQRGLPLARIKLRFGTAMPLSNNLDKMSKDGE